MKKYYRKRAQFRKQKTIGLLITLICILAIPGAFILNGLMKDVCAAMVPILVLFGLPLGLELMFSKTYYILDGYYFSLHNKD